ncbi:MAG TPA: hypothetical protein VFE50_24155 [Cyclobacteriaceae bacterium]|nr:hypothetical protein [Cyclobacteriaceae bacterium]
MENERPLSPQESMEVILRAISRTKEDIRVNSFYFLLWGWLIAIASFGFFVLMEFVGTRWHFLPFPILGLSGMVITVVHYNRRRVTSTESHLTYFLSRMWAVLGICILISVFINVRVGVMPFTYTLLLGGIGTLVSGWTMKFRPLVFGGVVFLVTTIVSVFLPEEYKALLHGVAIVTGYLVPGYLLKNADV